MSAELVDEAALKAWLTDRLPLEGPAEYRVERHRAGLSNETFFVRWGGRDLVLRRPPAGAFLPTAHDVLREHRVLSALEGTPARTPRPVAACDDETVIGAPFYLMERVHGHVLRRDLPQEFGPAGMRARIGDELVDALAELHGVEWRGTPLAELGKPDGYLERQVRRWRGQLDLTAPHTAEAREVPDLVEVADWLASNVPRTERTTLVHGDYKLDNVVFQTPDGDVRLAAVLDWEMSTLGDPLADLGWMLSFWREPGDPRDDLLSAEPRFTELPGFRSRKDLVRHYREATGLAVDDLRFHVTLAIWKLAILLEGSYARHLAGATDNPFYAQLEQGVPALARRALATARGERGSFA